jgi:hypothetical protein
MKITEFDPETHEIDLPVLCAIVGKSEEFVRQLVLRSKIKKLGHGRYPMRAAIRACLDHMFADHAAYWRDQTEAAREH